MSGPGEFKSATVELIWDRDEGRCALCGKAVLRQARGALFGWSLHHREDRGVGGVKRARPGREQPRAHLALAANGVVLCGDGVAWCHGRVTRNEVPARLGFTVARIGIRRPVEVPIKHYLHGWVLLDNRGGFVAVEEPAEVAA